MNIKYLSKPLVLQSLYREAAVQGMGFLQARGKSITIEEATEIINKSPRLHFDYLYGKVLKVDLSKNELNTWLYNRDNGKNAAEIAIINGALSTQKGKHSKKFYRQMKKSFDVFVGKS